MRWDLTGSSLGDSPKGSGSSLGTRREIAGKKTRGLAARMPKATRLCRKSEGGQQLSTGKPPKWWVNHPYHRIWAAANTSGG
ncbi:hypothetical protein B296_00053015 [Ensete ventricosum]|uniref:Uncharacterized protein n=1 Tax=Ensete ventricosum TaxID=4639 RepID=A0A426WY28_ENSVE|nr:hypothetical protein B296_00053015 [Ensete ventricosum]